MRKKWSTSQKGRNSSSQQVDQSPNSSEKNGAEQVVLAPRLLTSFFNSITKLDRNELDKFLGNDEENNQVGMARDEVLKQKLWGLSVGHVLVNRSDDEIIGNSSEGRDLMIEKVNEMLIYLMDLGLDLNVEERKSCMKPIHLAAKRCSFSFKWIMTMIEKGGQSAVTCCGSELGFTPLDYAISNNRLELVKSMLDCEMVDFGEFLFSNHDSKQNERRKLLPCHVASQSGNVEILEFLIDHACKYYLNNNYSKIQQLSEFNNSSIDSLSDFTKQFLSIKTRDVNNQTPLHLAVRDGHISCIKLLLEKGADPLLADHVGKTSVDYARVNFINKMAIIEELQKYVDFEILPPLEPIIPIQQIISNIEPESSVVEEISQETEFQSESNISKQDEDEENENIYFM